MIDILIKLGILASFVIFAISLVLIRRARDEHKDQAVRNAPPKISQNQ